MNDSIDLQAALARLREVRAERREEAIQQANLLHQLYQQAAAFIGENPVIDPITKAPILSIAWSDAPDRGVSMVITALGEPYAVHLEVHYEHGDVLVSGVKCVYDEDDFRDRVFRGMPLRLERDAEGKIQLVRRRSRGGDYDEVSFEAINLIGTFIDAVQLSETHHI